MIHHWLHALPEWIRLIIAILVLLVPTSPGIWFGYAFHLRSKQRKEIATKVKKKWEHPEQAVDPTRPRTPFGLELLSKEEQEELLVPEHDMSEWLGERKISTLNSTEAEILAGALSSKSFNFNASAAIFGFLAVIVSSWSAKEISDSLLHPGSKGHPIWLFFIALNCQLLIVCVPFVLKYKADRLKAKAELFWKRAEAAKKIEKTAAARKSRRLRAIIKQPHTH